MFKEVRKHFYVVQTRQPLGKVELILNRFLRLDITGGPIAQKP